MTQVWEDSTASFAERCEASQLLLLSDAIKPRYSSSSGRDRFRGVRWPAELCRQIRELANPDSNPTPAVALARRARRDAIQAKSAENAAGSDSCDAHSQVDPSIFDAVLEAANQVVESFVLGVQFDVQLERAKLDAMKQLAYGASHEVNNPLANISTRAQTLLRDETSPDRRQKLAAIVSQAFRAHDMISNMMLYGHPPEHSPSAFGIREWFKQLVPVLAPLWSTESPALVLKLNEWQLELDGSEVPESAFDQLPHERLLWGDPEQLSILVQCLARNAFEAMDSEGKVAVSILAPPTVTSDSEEARYSEGDGWEIVVSDDGPGMSPEIRRHCFDPFYSGREAGRGLGFGLSKAWAICRLHEGHICITPGDPKGISVRCWFPGQTAGPASNEDTCSMHKASSCKTIPTAG